MAHVSSVLQFNGTMDTWFKPKFVILGHPFLFDNMFVCPFVCLAFCFPRLALFTSLLSSLLVCWLLSLFVACTCLKQGHLERGHDSLGVRREQKGQGCKQEDASPNRVMFSRLGGLASSCVFFSPPLLATSLEHCIRFITLVSSFKPHS